MDMPFYLLGHVLFFKYDTQMSPLGHVRECPRVMLPEHQCFCSEIGHVNVLESCVQRTFLETIFNAIIFFIIMY
jgi:hypothetical protein